jgi:hypothetical protein
MEKNVCCNHMNTSLQKACHLQATWVPLMMREYKMVE